MYEYNLKAMDPEGMLPPLNDAGRTPVRQLLQEGHELFGREDFLWSATEGRKGTRPAFSSVAMPYAGQYVMRSGWEPDARFCLFESGPYGIGHQHEDKLSLFVHALGRELLTEAGTYRYDQSAYRRYVLGTWAHNTILVDGEGQRRSGLRETYETDRPLDNLWLHNDLFDAADGAYSDGYGPRRTIQIRHERTVVFLRNDYWVILDRIDGEGEHRLDILWHLKAKAAAQLPGTLAAHGTDPGVPNLLVVPAPHPGLALETVTGRHNPPLGFAPASRKTPIPVLDYQLPIQGRATLAWVLFPYSDGVPSVSLSCRGEPTTARSSSSPIPAAGTRSSWPAAAPPPKALSAAVPSQGASPWQEPPSTAPCATTPSSGEVRCVPAQRHTPAGTWIRGRTRRHQEPPNPASRHARPPDAAHARLCGAPHKLTCAPPDVHRGRTDLQ